VVYRVLFSLVLFCVVFLNGCAPITTDKLIRDGKKPLDVDQLKELVTINNLELTSINFDAEVQFLPDGQLSAVSRSGESVKGKWSITTEDQLCLKFERWYYGDVLCYTVFNDGENKYIFFTSNGARSYSAFPVKSSSFSTSTSLTSETPKQTKIVAGTTFSDLSSSTPTRKEQIESLHRLARNCPGCNLSGVDLKDAQLIEANLSGANLKDIDLSGANLRRANLSGANLSGARLIRTNLSGANLSNCDLSYAEFSGSNLIRANITDANLTGTVFTGAHLESVQGLKK